MYWWRHRAGGGRASGDVWWQGGTGGVKNSPKTGDIIYGWPQMTKMVPMAMTSYKWYHNYIIDIATNVIYITSVAAILIPLTSSGVAAVETVHGWELISRILTLLGCYFYNYYYCEFHKSNFVRYLILDVNNLKKLYCFIKMNKKCK